MRITFIAQSGFIIEEDGITIGIDLWLGNPVNPRRLEDIPKLNYIFCTHDHPDHGFTNSVELAKRDLAPLLVNNELAQIAAEQGVETVVGANIGGEFRAEELKVFLTPAFHSSNTGVPVGFIIQFPNGKTIYHMGDTGYFDLKYIPELYKIDVLFIPIGSHYTMGVREAIMAVRDIKPVNVIPMHYNTFPQIQADPNQFNEMVQSIAECSCLVLKLGESLLI